MEQQYRKADRENILELERQRANISFDEEINYEVDFTARRVVYYGVYNESYEEEYPAVEVKL